MLEKSDYSAIPQGLNETEIVRSKASIKAHKRQQYLLYIVGIWAVVTTIFATYSLSVNSHSIKETLNSCSLKDQQENYADLNSLSKRSAFRQRKRNLIFMVSDGMGPASLSMTRSFRQFTEDLPIDDILTLDKNLVGSHRTRSADSLITDSAAGATAFACGIKTYNNGVSIHPDTKVPCGNILEAAKLAGYTTGMVVTTEITDATPAAFSSHVEKRFDKDIIAQQQLGENPLGRVVDLMIGGGRCNFLPKGKGGCRKDDLDLVEKAKTDGWTYFDDLTGFKSLQSGQNVTLPLLGLLAPTDIPYEIDRNSSVYPSLEDTTKTALRALALASEDNDQGFFVLIEGSRIDHAGHSNDPAAQVREVLAYDRAFQAAIDFANESDTETIIISTSDHETGGLTVGKQLDPDTYPEYLWLPEVLANTTHSGEYLAEALKSFNGTAEALNTFVTKNVLLEGLGIKNITQTQVDNITKNKEDAIEAIAQIVGTNAQIGWTTHGHTAVDVNVYAYAKNRYVLDNIIKSRLVGNHENTDIGLFMADYLDVDLKEVSKELTKTPFKTSSSA
ncbi:hypothetical protein DV495_004688 [Geotrichum candidum]|uniref:Alkaline phosphatase n=1 Tax=Geotrichum candidum TaxID=1173061 RepID=A0A0J9X772_GEOCN|nr:hypothetical protein DV495_004688 [Geotrichum candidum]KAF5120552.1 hypothetical protein DV452_001184 [Geotrichum candidum]KAF7500477.1 hypothetical protein DV113_001470 [Geotrichum candidum]KAI9215001.1 hypothetical protein DS838_000167 [Geotrichum bryndzae]CDO53071.1 similar to Saccharomyces cerevisiae YDR481C PHO8 Repressible vacuolar alkaline phosphatase [Geotrichum candidum]